MVLLIIKTVLYMPVMDILLRTINSTYHSVESLTVAQLGARYAITGFVLVLFPMLILYIERIFNIRVPTRAESIPWCAPFSKLTYIDLLVKLILILSNSLDTQGQLIVLEVIVLFCGTGFIAVYRLMFVPNFNQQVDYLVKGRDFTLFFVTFIGIFCILLKDQSNLDIIYLIFTPIVNLAWYTANHLRRTYILNSLKHKSLHLEPENEFALHTVTQVVRQSLSLNQREAQEHFGEFMSLVFAHMEDCQDEQCMCHEIENYQELVRLKMGEGQEMFSVEREQEGQYQRVLGYDRGGNKSAFTQASNQLQLRRGNASEINSEQGYTISNSMHNPQSVIAEGHQDNQAVQMIDNPISKVSLVPDSHKKPSADESSKHYMKVNMYETQHRFLSEIIYLYVYNIMEKFPLSIQIQLYVNYYTLFFRKKELLAIFQMRHFAQNKLGFIDSICYAINEMYLLEEVQYMKKNKDDLPKDDYTSEANLETLTNQRLSNQMDGEYFIKMHQLTESFSLAIEQLAQTVSSFWRQLKNTTMEVHKSIENGFVIANNARHVFQIFNQMDEASKYKDFRSNFQLALVQLHILNDPVGYEVYIGKMKSILEINQVFQKNFSTGGMQQQDIDNSNFLIVDANGRNFGRIILFNKNLRQLLGRTDQEIRNLTIDDLMPAPIQKKHNAFIKRFNQTGQAWIINNRTTMFIKKASGYVVPAELMIKFHYSLEYNYTFLATIKPLEELCPFQNGTRYKIDQLLFFVVETCDNEGCISEYSESCKQLEELGLRLKSDSTAITKRIIDVVKDLDFERLTSTRLDRLSNNEVYEAVHELDLTQLQDDNRSHLVKGIAGPSFQTMYGKIKARVRILEERYSDGLLDLNIFCFSLYKNDLKQQLSPSLQLPNNQLKHSNPLPLLISSGGLSPSKQDHLPPDDHLKSKSPLKEVKDGSGLDLIDHGDQYHSQSQSMSMSSSSADGSGSLTLLSEFRSFNMLTLTEQQKTPKTLSMIVKLIVLLYIIMMAVASVNLWINVSRQSQSETDIHTVKNAYDRQLNLANNLIMMRTMINTANGNERDYSPIINGSRFTWYKPYQEQAINDFKIAHTYLQQSHFQKSAEFIDFENSPTTVVSFLSDTNKPYDQNLYQSVAFATYISMVAQINKQPRSSFQGNIDLLKLNGIEAGQNYTPNEHEQAIYFITTNSLKPLRRATIDSCFFYAREAEDHANSSQTTTMITAVMSIVSIVIIGLVISPMLTRAETRKYFAILYFLKIPKQLLDGLIQNCEYCLNMKDEKRFYTIKKDYQKLLGLKFMTERYEQEFEQKGENENVLMDEGKEKESAVQSSDYQMLLQSSYGEMVQSSQSSVTPQNANIPRIKENTAKKDIIESESKFEKCRNIGNSKQQVIIQEKDQYETSKRSANEEEKEANDSSLSLNREDKPLKQKGKRNQDHIASYQSSSLMSDRSPSVRRHDNQIIDESQEEKEAKLQEQIALQLELTQTNELIVQRSIIRRRMIMIATTLSLIVLLSSYFLIAYFLSIRTFNSASQVISSLEVVFQKGSCFDFTSSFIKANLIRNQSVTVRSAEDTASGTKQLMQYSASEYYLAFCARKEQEYMNMRKENPPYFAEAREYIEILESNQICDKAYNSSKPHLIPVCHEALNGILKQGLSNAYSYMYNYLQKTSMKFDVAGPTYRRTEEFLKQLTDDPTLIAIQDIKARLMTPFLDALNLKTMTSSINYIHSMLNDSMTAFMIFTVLMTFCLFLILFSGFKIMKKSMLDTNILLRIIPFEHLPKEYREDIKEFFKQ